MAELPTKSLSNERQLLQVIKGSGTHLHLQQYLFYSPVNRRHVVCSLGPCSNDELMNYT